MSHTSVSHISSALHLLCIYQPSAGILLLLPHVPLQLMQFCCLYTAYEAASSPFFLSVHCRYTQSSSISLCSCTFLPAFKSAMRLSSTSLPYPSPSISSVSASISFISCSNLFRNPSISSHSGAFS